MPDDPCKLLKGAAKKYCEQGGSHPGDRDFAPGGGGLTKGASDHVKDLATYLIGKIVGLVAPKDSWAPKTADNWVYAQFLWLGQHLAIAIMLCVVVVCALTAWQGAPRLRQLGASTGWTLAAVAGMAAVPGVVTLLSEAVSAAVTAMFDSNGGTLFQVIQADLDHGSDSGNPLALMIITAALVVLLAFATLVFMARSLGILVFVCMAPLVLASLARGGDTSAVKAWAMRLLGLMFAPFALILISPFVDFAKGSLVMDAGLLVVADALILRMIFHGVPYVGPVIAGAARSFVESYTTHPLARAVVRAGSPDFYQQESIRTPRTVDTPGRAVHQDRGVLLAAYGIRQQQRPGRLTVKSAIDRVQQDAPRTQALMAARQKARAAAKKASPRPATSAAQTASRPARPAQSPGPGASTPPTP
ncbi:hypothetical protein AB0F11_33305 [Streptomyces sp. NPDC032472]|uniref:hypothetical protein n=1 Tax=Streptomyces sp. NPDC032472 TaxID=3155018 RepID=UPI0033E848B8